MKTFRFLFLTLIFGVFAVADEFIDAITSGQKDADISLIFDYANSSGDISGTKYQDNAYLALSFGLHYASSFYGYFRAHLGFRGAVPLIQSSKNSLFEGGRGDAARDFARNSRAMLSRTYLEYFDGDTSIKAGRLKQDDDLLYDDIDGVWLQNKSLGFLLIDVAWINQHGTVLPRELKRFQKFDTTYGGAYYAGFTLDVFEFFKLKAYGLSSPDYYSYIGAKAVIHTNNFNASAGYVQGFEHKNSAYKRENSSLFHVDVGGGVNIFYGKIGYLKTSSEAGMGSLDTLGNTFSPFFYFSGDALSSARDVNLVYAKLGIHAEVLRAYLVYGYNMFKLRGAGNGKYSQGEVNLFLDWRINDITSVVAYFINTHGAKNAIPTLNQFGVAFKLAF